MSVEKFPVIIAGAGPAGVIASLSLSKFGQKHLILDKATFPRDKICGDAISGKPLEILHSLRPEATQAFSKSASAIFTHGIQFNSPNGKSVDIPFPKPKSQAPIGLVSRREEFDNFLFSQLIDSEAVIWQNSKLTGLERIGQGIRLTIECEGKNRFIETPLVIAADGSRSTVKRGLLGDDQDDKHFCGGIRAYYSGIEGLHSENYLELHFLKDLLPGYFWIFPLPNGNANVGMGMLSSMIKHKRINLRKTLLNAIQTHPSLKKRFVHAELQGKIIGWGLPLGSKKRCLSGDNFLLTGDAASLIDPFTGEGIGNAAVSGTLAADYTMQAIKTSSYTASTLANYDMAVYEKLWNELKTSYRLQTLSSYPWLFNFVVNRIRSSRALQDVFTNMFTDLDMRAQMQNPLFYLRLLFR